MRATFLTILMLLGVSFTAAAGQQQEPTDTDKALHRALEALEQEPNLSPETKAALKELLESQEAERARPAPMQASPPAPSKGQIAAAVDEYLSARPPVIEKAPWQRVLDRLVLFGDFRVRLESDFRDDRSNRQRARLRLRLGANYSLSDQFLIGARVVTGDADDPRSSHITLGDGFNNLEISLDRAFLTYRPLWLDGSYLTAGKFNNPIYRNPVYGELVWDADVNPEGIVGGYTFAGNGALERVDLMLGGYTVLEDSSTDDVYMLATQATGHFAPAEDFSAAASVTYYLYSDPNPDGNSTLLGSNAGNAVIDTTGDGLADAFLSDFGIVDLVAATTYTGWSMPLTVSGQYILNTLANSDRDQGWAVGASLGTTQRKGDWRFYYQWQRIEQDAVFSAFAQDDFPFTTNFRGSVFGANYQFTDNIGLHLWTLSASPLTPGGDDVWRLRLDLNVKF